MTITEKLFVSFDPVKEYKAMIEWVKANDMGEWKKYESTVSLTFVREKTVFIEAEEGSYTFQQPFKAFQKNEKREDL